MGIALVACGLVASGTACSNEPAPIASPTTLVATGTAAPRPGGTMRIGVAKADPTLSGSGLDTLDPAEVFPTNQANMIAIDLLFESLSTIDPATNTAKPALAAEITPSADLTTWTFRLRAGATFSDGSPVTAADVKFTYERLAKKGTSLGSGALDLIAGYGAFLDGTAPDISGLKVIDERVIEITTTAVYAALPELLASPVFGIVPKKSVETLQSAFAERPVGSGAFAFLSADDASVRLTRAPGSSAKLDAVQLVKFADKKAALQGFADGKVDWAAVPFGETVNPIPPNSTTVMGLQSSERFFSFNLGNATYGANPKFRQAIVKAVDRKKIALEALNSKVPISGVVPPVVSGSSEDACGDPCAFNLAAVKLLLAEAFPNGAAIPPVQIDYYTGTTPEDLAQQKAAEGIQADLTAAGIPVQMVAKPFEEYRSFAAGTEKQLFSYGWVGLAPDPDAYIAPLFISNSNQNVTGFKDAGVDTAIAAARGVKDRTERLKAYAAIEKQVMALVPILPLAVLETSLLVGTRVKDYQPRFDGTFAVDQVSMQP